MAKDEMKKNSTYSNPQPSDFRTRLEKVKIVTYPESTQDMVIIKSNGGGYGYRVDPDELSLFRDRVNFEEAKRTIESASVLVTKEYCKAKKEQVKNRHAYSYFALKIAMFMVIISFCVFQYPVFVSAKESTNIIYGGFVCLGFALFITIIVIVRTMLLGRDKKQADEVILDSLDRFFKVENLKYKRYGVEWKVGPQYFWLELHKFGRF